MNEDTKAAAVLGPRLYGETVHITPAVVYTSLGTVFMLLGVLLCFVPPDPKAPPNAMLIGGGVVAIFGAACLVIGLARLMPNLGSSWHLHQRGICLVRRSGEQMLAYKDVDELTLKVTRVFLHGVCTGEVYEATFQRHRPANRISIKQVRRPSSISGSDLNRSGEVAQACDQVAELIASRMTARLDRGEPIPWVQATRIYPDGLDVESAAIQGRIKWSEIERVEIKEGKFQLWRRGDVPPAIEIPTHLPNFFPGYRLILNHSNANTDSSDSANRAS
jgi:hypothetical protein